MDDKKIVIQCAYNINIPLSDFGEKMLQQFKILFDDFYMTGNVNISEEFKCESKKIFNDFTDIRQHDRYFENFMPIMNVLLSTNRYDAVFKLWMEIISFVKEWEENLDKRLHKGTPYYFAGASALLQDNIDAGLICMHNALHEDVASNNGKYIETPAYLFVTLNDKNPYQWFKSYVDFAINFLRDRMDGCGNEKGKYKDHYNNKRGILSYSDFRIKFLDNTDEQIENIKYYFIYGIIKLLYLRKLQKQNNVIDELMAPLIFMHAIGTLLLVIENLMKIDKSPNLTFCNLIESMGLGVSCNGVNEDRDEDFDKWCLECLSCDTIEKDFILSYGLRNFTFHEIKNQKFIIENYTKILQSVLNCLFYVIEKNISK